MSPHTSHVALVALREAVVAGEITAAQAAESVGIPRGTLYGRWRSTGLLKTMPIVPRGITRSKVHDLIERNPGMTDDQIGERWKFIDLLSAVIEWRWEYPREGDGWQRLIPAGGRC